MTIGKNFIIGVTSTRLLPKERELLQKYQPAGVMLFRKNFHINTSYKQWTSELRDLIKDVRDSIGREQIIIATDFEGGRVSHFPPPVVEFPFAMKFMDLSSEVAAAQAEILKAHGFNFSFGPVVDIHSNSSNPVIGPRAFGTSPQEVIKYTVPFMQRLMAEGGIPCIKHFPGHGETKTDSHLSLPYLEHDLDFLRSRELLPFKALIEAGAPCVMSAHIIFKQIDAALPATMSKTFLSDILRQELGFKGVILSDCLSGMRAIVDNFSIDQVMRNFIEATGDLAVIWQKESLRHEDYLVALDRLAQSDAGIASCLSSSHIRIDKLLAGLTDYQVSTLQPEQITRHQSLVDQVCAKAVPVFLQESEYQPTSLPQEEPAVRVGVVLLEDKISQEFITFPQDGEVVGVDGENFEIKAGTRVEINATIDGLDIYTWNGTRTHLVYVPNKVILRTHQPVPFAPCCGFKVERVVAGRIFHWRKEIEQYLTGRLEIYSQRGILLIVNELPFEEYLSGVATAEMSSECPMDTLKAQVLAARSYSLAYMHGKHRGEPFSVCNDDDCQRYQGTTHVYPHIHQAIQETRGEVIAINNQVVRAHYSKCCGGFLDRPEDTWEISVPGLSDQVYDGVLPGISKLNLADEREYRNFLNLPDSEIADIYCATKDLKASELKKYLGTVDVSAEYFRWHYELTAAQLLSNLKERFGVSDIAVVKELRAVASKKTNKIRTRSGRLTAIEIVYLDHNNTEQIFHIPREYNIRRALHQTFLFSSAFVFEHVYEGMKLKSIKFHGSGWGHGAGYCQIGALGMGLKGIGYKQIIQHYFPDCGIKKCY